MKVTKFRASSIVMLCMSWGVSVIVKLPGTGKVKLLHACACGVGVGGKSTGSTFGVDSRNFGALTAITILRMMMPPRSIHLSCVCMRVTVNQTAGTVKQKVVPAAQKSLFSTLYCDSLWLLELPIKKGSKLAPLPPMR